MIDWFHRRVRVRRHHTIAAGVAAVISAAIFGYYHWPIHQVDAHGRAIISESTRVPKAAIDVYDFAQAHDGAAQEGFVGGRAFADHGRSRGAVLPNQDKSGKAITYREYDVRPKQPGMNRGPERVVIGSDGSAYYTSDHYKHFKKFR
jgi:hypothetical protein